MPYAARRGRLTNASMGSIPPKRCCGWSGIERLADEMPLAEDCINPVSASSASSARDLRLRSLFHMEIRNEGRQSRTGVRTKRAPPATGATRDVSAQLAFKVGIAIRDQAEVVLRGVAGKNPGKSVASRSPMTDEARTMTTPQGPDPKDLERVAQAALTRVADGMILGLGTGRVVIWS